MGKVCGMKLISMDESDLIDMIVCAFNNGFYIGEQVEYGETAQSDVWRYSRTKINLEEYLNKEYVDNEIL